MSEEDKYSLFAMKNGIYSVLFLLNHNIGKSILGFKFIYGNVHYEHESGGHVWYTVCTRIWYSFPYSLGNICGSKHYVPPDGNIQIQNNLHYTHM